MYAHQNDSAMAPPSTAHHSEGSGQRDHVPSDSRAQVQCSFFAKGKCLKGDKCVFAHSGDAGAVSAEVSTSEIRSHSSFTCCAGMGMGMGMGMGHHHQN